MLLFFIGVKPTSWFKEIVHLGLTFHFSVQFYREKQNWPPFDFWWNAQLLWDEWWKGAWYVKQVVFIEDWRLFGWKMVDDMRECLQYFIVNIKVYYIEIQNIHIMECRYVFLNQKQMSCVNYLENGNPFSTQIFI